jgi:hypothetical protein
MVRTDSLYSIPQDLPVPEDDGTCDHLPGSEWPPIALPSTRGRVVSVRDVQADSVVVYFYPRTRQNGSIFRSNFSATHDANSLTPRGSPFPNEEPVTNPDRPGALQFYGTSPI